MNKQKENSLGVITWSEMGKQNVKAKEVNLFHGPMFGKIKTKLLLIPGKGTPNMGSKQFDCPITLLHFK